MALAPVSHRRIDRVLYAHARGWGATQVEALKLAGGRTEYAPGFSSLARRIEREPRVKAIMDAEKARRMASTKERIEAGVHDAIERLCEIVRPDAKDATNLDRLKAAEVLGRYGNMFTDRVERIDTLRVEMRSFLPGAPMFGQAGLEAGEAGRAAPALPDASSANVGPFDANVRVVVEAERVEAGE